MAQIISTICDQHQVNDVQVAARTYAVGLQMPGGKRQEFEVDLCDDCAKALAVVQEFLSEVGRPPGKPPRKTKAKASTTSSGDPVPAPDGLHGPMGGPVPESADGASLEERTCPTGCGYVSASVGGLQDHAKRQHDTSLSALRGKPLDYTCPECPEAFTTPQGLGAHRRTIHGVAGTSKSARAYGAPEPSLPATG